MANQYINALTATWNSAVTTYKGIALNVTNASSAADSKLFDLLISSVSKFNVDKNGNVVLVGDVNAATATITGNATVGGTLGVTGAATLSSLTLTTDLAVADGGTGASTAAAARTNLGLGSIATQASTAVDITGGTISGVTTLSATRAAAGNYGLVDFYNSAGVRGGYMGYGNGGSTLEIIGDNATTLNFLGWSTVNVGTISLAASNVNITGGSIAGITDLAVADGGTGASTAVAARTNLGLGSIATQASTAVGITGGTISGVTTLSATRAAAGNYGLVEFYNSAGVRGGYMGYGNGGSTLEIIGDNATTLNFLGWSTVNVGPGVTFTANRINTTGGSTGATYHAIYNNPNGLVGGIVVSASSTSYNTTSDGTLKTKVVDADTIDAIAKIKAGQPRNYEYTAEPGATRLGFVAQEIAQVFPECVTPGDADTPWMMDYGKLTPVIWGALKRLTERVEKLDANLITPEPNDYRASRKDAYYGLSPEGDMLHSVGDTLDVIVKQVEMMRQTLNVGMHPEYEARLAAIAAIKTAYPKPAV